ncbi:conserved membrane hypothetical protein [Nostocoides japonicum T1-X7]|uniref:Integral membrane protein n=1 Tax=Nostocoides japonicum T1-X7 TaxID=1194083 RepID=A0A077M900_9MICO|nr:M50 family metallopeptidase [Tetrasphaera japonica]CCH80519.1 conserved membrane hypothetical protein [Tetrasphaera japonica T1-X7]
MDLTSTIWERIAPAPAGAMTGSSVVLAFAVALAVCLVPGLWRWMRLAVTLVHELGHAGVGILVGRRFTGFVVRGDMSGHAVTAGRPTGLGRVATTWAGYPMPAVVGAGLVLAATGRQAAPVLTALILILLGALLRARSAGTLLTLLVSLGIAAATWWWRSDAVQAQLLLGLGVVLLVGAWRHLGAVMSGAHPRGIADVSDPGVLHRLTHIPRVVWTGSFVLVLAAASWYALLTLHTAATG